MNPDTNDRSQMNQPLFDICIVNFNTRDLTKVSIDMLQKAIVGMPCIIYVVDNGSTDGSIEMLETMDDITLIRRSPIQPEEGHIAHAVAIDLAFLRTSKKYLILMHTDTIVYRREAILTLLEAVSAQPNIAAAGCLDQVYRGVIGTHLSAAKKRINFYKKTFFYKLGLRNKLPRMQDNPVHIRSFFSIWNVMAMKEEGLCFNMGNRNPGYEAQDLMTGRGYVFVSVPPRYLFQHLDHLEAATVAQVNPYHFRHRNSKAFRKKLRQVIGGSNGSVASD